MSRGVVTLEGTAQEETDPVKDIFVVGLDHFDLAQLERLPDADDYRFHPLFTSEEVTQRDASSVEMLIDEGPRRLAAFAGRIDAVDRHPRQQRLGGCAWRTSSRMCARNSNPPASLDPMRDDTATVAEARLSMQMHLAIE